MIDLSSNRPVRIWSIALSCAAAAAMIWALSLVFIVVPTEQDVGRVQQIDYVHLPSAWVGFLAFGIVALCSVGYLALEDQRLDDIAVAAAELGLVFATVALITGSILGRLASGAWWVWDARLTLTLLLWLIYVSYFLVRNGTDNAEKGKRFAAIVGIIAAIDIPLIHVSVNWFRTQHPEPIVLRPEGPTADPDVVPTLLICLLAFLLTFFALLLHRYVVQRMTRQVEALRFEGRQRSHVPAEGVFR